MQSLETTSEGQIVPRSRKWNAGVERIDVRGPFAVGSTQIGPEISGDFPQVLEALAARSEGRA